jgi:hypothetical protein
MPGDPSIWTTVGPDKPYLPGGIEVARAPLDENGDGRLAIKVGALPADVVLVQTVALSPEVPARALAVSDCMAVSRKDGALTIRPHVVEVLLSPIWWRIGAVAALVVVGILLRRSRIPGVRWATLVLALAAAAWLLVERGRAPRNTVLSLDSPNPFLPNDLDEGRRKVDPLDRITRPGFHELVTGAREAGAGAGTISIVLPSIQWESVRDAWQAQWLLWPRHVEILPPETDPWARRGVYLTFDAGPKKPGAHVLYKNQAGCLWSIAEGEPK